MMEPTRPKPRVVIVDDDEDVVASFVNAFSDEFEVIGVTVPEEALTRIDDSVAVAVVDERMPRISGVKVLGRLQAKQPEVMRILLTAYANLDRLAAAVNEAGIFYYMAKPWRDGEMRQVLRQAAEMHRLQEENRQLMRRLQQERDILAAQKQFLISRDAHGFAALVGESKKLWEVIAQARRAVDSCISVLIEGETGTGKELLARAIHYEGARRDQLFVAINCPALPEPLLESELFGHEKGAFTGAVVQKKGKLEIADGGTVFLDEVQHLTPMLQAKLLRVLQEREFERVGGTRPIKVDVRWIAATSRSLRAEMEAGRFSDALYYRLAAFRLTMPPLRERPEDIPALAQHFLSQANAESGRKIDTIADDAVRALYHYRFHGNVRELKNEIGRAVLFAEDSQLELGHFSEVITAADGVPADLPGTTYGLKARMREHERREILDALMRADGNRRRAAKELGISHRWLLQRMQVFGLSRNR